mgnify:FL=1|jgi:hypothetical protein|tara:strand:- start:295 stop:774 length:480 start_codon:yes stop_codon:yes gene_type:complete
MEKINKLLNVFSETYPLLKDVVIETEEYSNLYVAKCMVDKIGEYINVKKGRILNIIPKSIILTTAALEKEEKDLIFIFIHECTHCITPHREKKVKDSYIRIDHSRQFYENFFILIKIANKSKYFDQTFESIEELMKRDNRNENISNDLKIYEKNQSFKP